MGTDDPPATTAFNFVYPRFANVSRSRDEFCSGGFSNSDGGISFSSIVNNRYHSCNRFNIVDHSWTIVQSFYSRKWRFDSWVASFSFERFQQCSLFATDISTGTGMYIHVEIVTCTQYIFSKPAIGIGFFDGIFQDADDIEKFTTHVDVGCISS